MLSFRSVILMVLVVGAGCLGTNGIVEDSTISATNQNTDSSEPQSNLPSIKLVAQYPSDGNYTNEVVLSSKKGDFDEVGDVQKAGDFIFVSVSFSEGGAQKLAESMRELGFLDDGVNACNRSEMEGYCLLTVVGDKPVYAASLGSGLAVQLESGEDVHSGKFALGANNESTAEKIRMILEKQI